MPKLKWLGTGKLQDCLSQIHKYKTMSGKVGLSKPQDGKCTKSTYIFSEQTK